MDVWAARLCGMDEVDIDRIRRQNALYLSIQERRRRFDISTVVQSDLRDKMIQQCFLEDTKRGRRKGGGSGDGGKVNEAKRLKVKKWDMKHRRISGE
jgi:hypothetical protein